MLTSVLQYGQPLNKLDIRHLQILLGTTSTPIQILPVNKRLLNLE